MVLKLLLSIFLSFKYLKMHILYVDQVNANFPLNPPKQTLFCDLYNYETLSTALYQGDVPTKRSLPYIVQNRFSSIR